MRVSVFSNLTTVMKFKSQTDIQTDKPAQTDGQTQWLPGCSFINFCSTLSYAPYQCVTDYVIHV